ncbi:MAG: hypothetical protein GY725_07410 [bacterium]|nr:hypothetical protein [bacterium]
MEVRERKLAQIVRDFMEAFVLAAKIGEGLRSQSLSFKLVQGLVGDAEDNVLHRLKEECHALFRVNDARPLTEVQAEELFDLAVGALFHETMKFREGYYLTTSYGPRLQRMMEEGSASGPLAEGFERAFEGGHRRMMESWAEASRLFEETRDQLLIVLHQIPPSGAVARSLIEDPKRTSAVFQIPLGDLLKDVFGSKTAGFRLAVDNLIENGHFEHARRLLEREDAPSDPAFPSAVRYAHGMEAYYSGHNDTAVEHLASWVSDSAENPESWSLRAQQVLKSLAETAEQLDPKLSREARGLAESLRQARSN